MRIYDGLYEMRDESYRDFQASLIPEIEAERMVGVRTPDLRAFAKELFKSGGYEEFIRDLPHEYFDEMQLHAFIISEFKDFGKCMAEVKRFLPHVDNWASCDQLSPRVFKTHRQELISPIYSWLDSDKTYTVRFGIKMLMQHFLDDSYESKYMDKVAQLRSDEYYINMMIAWYFATALAKQYDDALAVLKEKKLAAWTHNKAIQKAIESRRISDEKKDYLRSLKIKPKA